MPETLRDRVAYAIAMVSCGYDKALVEKPLTGDPNHKYWHSCRAQAGAVLKVLGISDAMYQHYKGNTYDFYAKAIAEDTMRDCLIYRAHSDGRFWVRDWEEFCHDTVDVNGETFARFKEVKQ